MAVLKSFFENASFPRLYVRVLKTRSSKIVWVVWVSCMSDAINERCTIYISRRPADRNQSSTTTVLDHDAIKNANQRCLLPCDETRIPFTERTNERTNVRFVFFSGLLFAHGDNDINSILSSLMQFSMINGDYSINSNILAHWVEKVLSPICTGSLLFVLVLIFR